MNTPDNWVILKVIKESETFYKVLAGWSGGYLDGDLWRMNSGIVSVEEDDHCYYFKGYSGSIYKCHKQAEAVRANIGGVLHQLLDQYPDSVSLVKFETMEMIVAKHIPEPELESQVIPRVLDDNF